MANGESDSQTKLGELLLAAEQAGFERAIRSTAHALGTPLNVSLGTADLALEDAGDSPLRGDLEQIRAQTEKMTALLKQVLRYAPSSKGAARETLAAVAETAAGIAGFGSAEAVFDLSDGQAEVPRADMVLVLVALAACAEPGTRIQLTCTEQRCSVRLKWNGNAVANATELSEPWFAARAYRDCEMLLAVAAGVIRRRQGELRPSAEGDLEASFLLT